MTSQAIHLFIPKYLLNTYCVPGFLLGAGIIILSESRHDSSPHGESMPLGDLQVGDTHPIIMAKKCNGHRT